MIKYDPEQLLNMLILHEGFTNEPYTDTRGFQTIGIGYNLDAHPIAGAIFPLTDEDVLFLCTEYIEQCEKELTAIAAFNDLDAVRQMVLIDMRFNLGLSGIKKFRKMWTALGKKDFKEASAQMRDSKWYGQVKTRAKRLCDVMKYGKTEGLVPASGREQQVKEYLDGRKAKKRPAKARPNRRSTVRSSDSDEA